MKKMVLIVMLILAGASSSGQDDYNEFISKVGWACRNPRLLLTTSFTNDVMAYRASCSNAQRQCAADLAFAISLMRRMDGDEACVANAECFRRHQSLVSNIVYRSDIDASSWIRYAAAIEYMTGLNYGNQHDVAFCLSTNMAAKIALRPPDMSVTNFWDSMSNLLESPNETLSTVFRLNAAVWLAEHNRIGEIASFTNSLPTSAINIFLDEMN